MQLSNILTQPLAIGNRQIATRLVLAPMSKIGHPPFRQLVSGFGGYGLLFSEMCNANAVANHNSYKLSGFIWRKEELPELVCQLYGNDHTQMARAAQIVEQEGFFGVDVNFSCSVSALCKRNCGAALLKDPSNAIRIVSAIRKAVSIPLFVKFRTGWNDDPRMAVELARCFEDAGADALTFHPRVAPDKRTRPPKWEYIGDVKRAVSIPVFGNGNVFDRQDCEKLLEISGCDGVALGRIAIARPWTFAEWTTGFKPHRKVVRDTAFKLLLLLEDYFGDDVALRRFKKFISYYSANFQFGHRFYADVCKTKILSEVNEMLKYFFDTLPEIVSKPHIIMLR